MRDARNAGSKARPEGDQHQQDDRRLTTSGS
jgi:hypothetical protein